MNLRKTQQSSRQRSKSLPSTYTRQSVMFGSRSIPSYKQQMRMVSFQSTKNKQEPKSQIDIPAVQKVLDEFEHILKNLQMTNSDISDLNVLMKDLKDRISRFPRFLSVNPEQRVSFFDAWETLKNQAIQKLESGQPNSYEHVLQQLNESKSNLKEIQTKSQSKQANTIINNLSQGLDKVEDCINELDQEKKKNPSDQKKIHELILKIKSDLLKLQSTAPTTKSNQDIARILLEFNKLEKREKSQNILNYNIQKTEKQLQALIQIKQPAEQNFNKSNGQASSIAPTNKKRSKSVGASDMKSHVSRASHISSKSLISKQLNDYDRHISNLKSKSLNLNHDINLLNMKKNRIKKSISTYKAQLNQLIEVNSIERDGYRKKVAEKIKKSGVPGCENYEQKEKLLEAERKKYFEYKQKLIKLDLEENERSELNHKIHEAHLWQAQLDEELKRANNLNDRLKILTSVENISTRNTNEISTVEINVDNNGLLKEKNAFEKNLVDIKDSINDWRESWRQSVGANLIDDLEDIPPSDVRKMYKRSEFDHEYIKKWKTDLDAQIDRLKKEASYLEKSGHKLDNESLNELKKAVDKLNFYNSAITNTKNKEKIPISKQIQINKMEIKRLSKLEFETKSDSQEIEDQRNQNRQMIEWVKELMDQIQSAMTSQNGLKAQLEKSMNMTVITDDDDDTKAPKRLEKDTQKSEELNKEILELSKAIYSKTQLKSEYEDNNTNMQQLYENIFYVQTNQNFNQLCPQVKERIKKLIEYHKLKRQYNHLCNPDAEDSDISIDFDADIANTDIDTNQYDTENIYDTDNKYYTDELDKNEEDMNEGEYDNNEYNNNYENEYEYES